MIYSLSCYKNIEICSFIMKGNDKMKAIVLHRFKDKVENKYREVNEIFELTDERFKEINTCDWCKKNKQKLVASYKEPKESKKQS